MKKFDTELLKSKNKKCRKCSFAWLAVILTALLILQSSFLAWLWFSQRIQFDFKVCTCNSQSKPAHYQVGLKK